MMEPVRTTLSQIGLAARGTPARLGVMEKLSIYEHVAVIVPGVAFLFGLGVLLPGTDRTVLLPSDFGMATVHLFLAFGVGHLLQVVGQLLHRLWWADRGGLPTDWPFTRQHKEFSPQLQQLVADVAGQAEFADLVQWRRAIATVRALVTADGLARRLETFHANYGMFRSLVVGGLALLFVTAWLELDLRSSWPVISAVMVISLLGMRAFGLHYARELFAAASAWQKRQPAREENPATLPISTSDHRKLAA